MGNARPSEPPLPDPLAYFITWSTYGTWLPGDQRGWTEYQHGWRMPDPIVELEANAKMTEDACRLNPVQRCLVEHQFAETCGHFGWPLLACNCRSNHVHIVVFSMLHPKIVRARLKAWATRRLKEHQAALKCEVRENWWAERGSQRWINDQESLEAAVYYVNEAQDRKHLPR